MNIEDQLKEYILLKYRSLLEFTQSNEIPYGTLQGVLKRGINNSSVHTIIRICNALGISTDSLAIGKIEPKETAKPIKDIEDLAGDLKRAMINNETYLDGVIMSDMEKEILNVSISVGLETIRGRRK